MTEKDAHIIGEKLARRLNKNDPTVTMTVSSVCTKSKTITLVRSND
jgi:hypothetical protein